MPPKKTVRKSSYNSKNSKNKTSKVLKTKKPSKKKSKTTKKIKISRKISRKPAKRNNDIEDKPFLSEYKDYMIHYGCQWDESHDKINYDKFMSAFMLQKKKQGINFHYDTFTRDMIHMYLCDKINGRIPPIGGGP